MQPTPYTLDFRKVDYPEPHVQRTREILKRHPEIRQLFGPTPSTAFFVLSLVGFQIGLSAYLNEASWLIILGASYFVGAFVSHGLWALIHDCTHNLVFRGNRANSWLQIIANLPHIFPSAMSFRKYHLLHHKYQGDVDYDADLAAPYEAKFAGNSSVRKALWLLFFFIFQSTRIMRLKKIPPMDRWIVANAVVEFTFVGLVLYVLGVKAFGFLILSSIFSVGLHPAGARWIQEHFMVSPIQETYSYYGPLNFTAFYVGYHNEHHDFISVPWSRLPKVRAAAPESYDTLVSHNSWTGLLFKFIFDPSLSLYSRTVRTRPEKVTVSRQESYRPEETGQAVVELFNSNLT
jgi:sphingolipid 4-desaturase/C4-monooxygenase